jgi:hypothetical protein
MNTSTMTTGLRCNNCGRACFTRCKHADDSHATCPAYIGFDEWLQLEIVSVEQKLQRTTLAGLALGAAGVAWVVWMLLETL